MTRATRVAKDGSGALVVLLRGVNVGGHKTFRPSVLIERLKPIEVINIGTAGASSSKTR